MLLLWIIAAVVGVAVIGFGSIGLLSRTLAATESAAIYDIDEATTWVADQLPTEIAARLSHEDVMAVLYWNLEALRGRGFATMGSVDFDAIEAAFGGEDVIASEEDVVDQIMDAASASDRDIEAVDIVTILELNGGYLDAIGALGVRTSLT